MLDEKTIIQRVLDGDQEAFAQLVQQYEKPVYNLCLRMAGNSDDAQDLAQEAFLKAWRGLRFYKFEATFSTWLYRLTSNVCIDFLRQQKRRPTTSLTVGDEEDESAELEIQDQTPLPEEQVVHREQHKAITEAMNKLDEEFRMLLTLRVMEERSYEQIAEIMDLKVGTVKSRISRAREKLRRILAETGNNFGCETSNLIERGVRHDV